MIWSSFLRDGRGNIAVAAGLLSAPLVLAVAMVSDIANMNRVKSDVQAALDAAAMEIALKAYSKLSDSELQALGEEYFRAQVDFGEFAEGSSPNFRYLGMDVDAEGNRHVSAEVDYRYRYLFSPVFSSGSGDRLSGHAFSLRTQIGASFGDDACLYALSRTASRAFQAAGNTAVTMDGCVIASNSAADDAIYVGGSARLEADCLQSSGGIDANGGLVTDCDANRENAWPLPDPFASIPEPVPPLLRPDPKNKDTTVQPGRYSNLTLDGTKHLAPGLYYIVGDLSIKGDISGSGVVFYMKDGSVSVSGNASLNLSSPQSGEYAGMLFMSSPTNTSAHVFNGNGATNLDGYLYFPKGDVTYTGNHATSSSCLRIVADTIKMSGSSLLDSDCSDELGGREAKVAGPLRYTL